MRPGDKASRGNSCLHLEGQRSPLTWVSPSQGYQWLKDKILSEEGRRQQAKLKELQAIAERLGCTLPQLAIGNGLWVQ